MRILKLIFLAFLGIIALALIVAAFLPKDFEIKSDIVINKPQAEVFDYIKCIKNQDYYGKWQLSDPVNIKKKYEGTDGSVGFKYSWESKKLGNGSQTITKIEDGKTIETKLDFGMGEPATSFMVLEPLAENQTKITWGIKGHSAWPTNLMGIFYDMSKDFDEGLQNLKRVLEK